MPFIAFIEKRDRKDSNGANVGYRNGLNLNEDLVSVDSWTKKPNRDENSQAREARSLGAAR